mgnify:CR=1 FL=1
MSNGNQLSQEELDALLAGVADDDGDGDDTEAAASAADDVGIDALGRQPKKRKTKQQPFDPGSQARIVRERLHTLEVINERFAVARKCFGGVPARYGLDDC